MSAIAHFMKLPLPYSAKEFERLQIVRKLEVDRFNRIDGHYTDSWLHEAKKKQAEVILQVVDKIFDYTNIEYYNKYAKNSCKFGFDEDTEAVCEKKFKNTIANYISNGNCCKSCNSVILNRLKTVY